MSHFELEESIPSLQKQVDEVECGVRAIVKCNGFRNLLQKVLFAGNCFNAGESTLGRADGYDSLELIAGQLNNNLPKGKDGVSFIRHLCEHELTAEDVETLAVLGHSLRSWTGPGADDTDQADLMDMQNEKAKLEKVLCKCQNILRQEHASGNSKGCEELLEFDNSKLKNHQDQLEQLETRLTWLRGEADEMRGDGLVGLQRYLLHIPPAKKKYAAGRILGCIATFARLCLECAQAKKPKRKNQKESSTKGH